MATRTHDICKVTDPSTGNAVTAQIDFNDANGSVARSRIINNTTQPAYVEAILDPPVSGFSVVGATGPAGTTTEQNFPNNVVKLTKVTDPDTGEVSWSLPGIELHCRWPA